MARTQAEVHHLAAAAAVGPSIPKGANGPAGPMTPTEIAQANIKMGPTLTLTRDQRHAARNLLDDNFDDQTGRYTKDWSDDRVARSVGVPLASIRDLREAAYGPLNKEDPELVALRDEFTTLRGMFAEFERRLSSLEKKGQS